MQLRAVFRCQSAEMEGESENFQLGLVKLIFIFTKCIYLRLDMDQKPTREEVFAK